MRLLQKSVMACTSFIFRLLNAVDVSLRAGLDAGGVGFVGVDVHGEREARVHAHQHVAEDQFAVAGDAHAHERLVAHAVAERVRGRHVDVAQRADDAAVQLHAAGRAFERAAGRVRDVAALADGRMHAELELLGHGDLDLGVLARRPEHAHALDAALRPDDGELLLAGKLAGLREVGVLRELVARAEQRLDVLLREVDVMRRDLDEKRLLLLRFEHARDVGAAQRAQRLARHHAFLVGGHDEHRHLRVVGRDAADLVEAARVAVALRVERDAHALQALQRQRAHLRAALADAAGEDHRVQPAHRGHVGADVLPHAVAIRLEREQRAVTAPRRRP